MSIEDQDLVAAAIDGDQVALQRLLLSHTSRLELHIGNKLPQSMQGTVSVDDVIQETFIQVIRDIGRFEERSDASFLTWLKGIADHRVHDAIKTHNRRKRGGDRQHIRPASAASGTRSIVDLAAMLSAGSHTPSRSVAGHEAVHAVQKVLDELPVDYRQAVQLRLLEGKGLDEVAELMNRGPRAVQGLIDRAKRKMRAALGRLSLYK